MRRRLEHTGHGALWAVVGALLAAYLVAFALNAAHRLALPAELMYGESIVLDGARRVAEGRPLYAAPDQLPLVVMAYTPLYYLLVGGLQRVFGDGYAVGRAVSLVATGAATLALVWGVRHVGGRWLGGLLAAGLFLTQNLTALLWAPLHRVDSLALCLALAGLALATAGRSYLATVPLLLAVMTKQTYLVAPLAVCLALWPDRRAMLGFGSLFACGLVLAISGTHAWSGGWFVWHVTLANANPFQLDYLTANLGPFLQYNGLPLLAATALFKLPAPQNERLWRLYFLGAVLTLPAIGKVGASSNYWLELSAATAALIGILAGRIAAHPSVQPFGGQDGLARLVAGALLVAIPAYQATAREVGQALSLVRHDVRYPQVLTGSPSISIQRELGPVLAGEPGDILTDSPSLAVAAGKPILFEALIFKLLAEQGLWDEHPILEAIAACRFELVILSAPLDAPVDAVPWTAAVRDALAAAYGPAGQLAGQWLYRPMCPATPLAQEGEAGWPR